MFTEARQHAKDRQEAEWTDTKASSGHNKPTVFDAIDMSDLPPSEKDIDRQAQEAFTLVSAGTETTARVIAACLFQLVERPESLARVKEELLQVMPNAADQPELKTLEKLPYLVSPL